MNNNNPQNGSGLTKSSLPRGLRNCNPLNIRITPKQRSGQDRWKGMTPQQTDPAFCQFESMEWGWRAAFHLLTRNYYHQHQLHTIRTIIGRWAPPKDRNNTEAYVGRVAQLMRYNPDFELGIPSMHPARWMMLGVAMAVVENGTDCLDYMAMLQGWQLLK